MAFKGKAGKSATGASMSKYDVEVEERLQALEAKAHDNCNHGDGGGVEEKLDRLIAALNANDAFVSSLPKDAEGVRKFS